MAKKLVIVESPAKAKTIGKFLGRGFAVKASMGHVRDLPRSQFGVDIERGFTPKYITVRGQGKVLQELRKAVKSADQVYLATDPDREGEAISWHLAEVLGLDPKSPNRIEFNEITKSAVLAALKNPRPIDTHRVDAQQARRVVDRLVGYKLSPLLWSKVKRGLSAGRVQSVALRLICDREQEIDDFVQEEYWTITASFRPPGAPASGEAFEAKLHRFGGKKLDVKDEAKAREIVAQLSGVEFVVTEVTRKERRRNPAPPFTTSTLQQEASRRLGFSARRTMSVAQQLYEGLDIGDEGTVGLITYLRTDSTRVSAEAQAEALRFIEARFGKEYVPAKPHQYKSREGAQGAHEAIRPTSVLRRPEDLKPYLNRDQLRLYRLIWERFIASQMAPAVFDTLTVDIEGGGALFRATGSAVKFPGFMSVYIEGQDEETSEGSEGMLPPLEPGDRLQCLAIEPHQHFTQPPPRYTEAMLVKTLEELGIGRPSTYVQIIDTIQKRGYVTLKDKRFVPTELGKIIVDLLKEHFPDIVDVEFTAHMEEQLDRIEEGEVEWRQVVSEFYGPFARALEHARKEIEEVTLEDEVTDEVCEVCGRNMVIKWGRYGKFLACPGFPECKNTRPLLSEIGVDCPECGRPLVERRSRKGRVFYGCSGYPECGFSSWQRPIARRCPRCGGLMTRVDRKGKGSEHVCLDKACGYREAAPDDAGGDGEREPVNGAAQAGTRLGGPTRTAQS
ncbi:MAG: type I DNA topoisomerase [Clostridia bacterium]|nr:type I DNA topoisomerase [Bacillota bacterium]